MDNKTLNDAEKLYNKEQFDQALKLYLQVLNDAEEKDKVNILRRIAECYIYKDQPDVDNALKYEEMVLEKIKNDEKSYLKEKMFYATILAEKDEKKALDIFNELEKIISEKYPELLPELYNNMGLLLWNDKKAAENYFKKALEISREKKDFENYILSLQNLSYLERENGNMTKALDYLKIAMDAIDETMKGIAKSKRKEFKESYMDVYDQAADLALEMEDFDLAMEITQRSKDIS